MATPLITAIRTFADAHNLSLPASELSLHFSHIQRYDYDALYDALAHLLPAVPESLHLQLYEVASHAFSGYEQFEELREACERFLPRDPVPVHAESSGEIEELDQDTSTRPTSHVSDRHPQLVQTDEINQTPNQFYDECEELANVAHHTSADGPNSIDTIDATLGKTSGESSSRWKLSEDGAFKRPKSCHRSLLYHAGYFSFERQFGVPYFATEAPAVSHRYYDNAPTNSDVQMNTVNKAVDRATSVEAHRSWRRRWSPREIVLLKELVASHAGGTRGDDMYAERDECKRIAKGWSVEVWDSLAVQAGKRLSGRPGHSLMCQYLNAGYEEWNDGDDAFLRDEDALNIWLGDNDGGWDVIGAAVKRPGIACLRRWEEIYATRKSVWSHADDARLQKAVLAVGKAWSTVALIMGNRTGPQCMHRYVKQLTEKRLGRWSLEEIQRLQEAIADVGNDWIEVARRVGTRNDVQCREKWVCGLDPAVKHGSWETDEDELLRKAVERTGGKTWKEVAKVVPWRTDTQCRRRWALLEQREPQSDAKEVKAKNRPRQKAGRWSREELERLRSAVLELGNAWKEVGKRVGTREEGQCREKWELLLKVGLTNADAAAQAGNKAGRWRKEEVRLLNEAVAQLGPEWAEVSTQVGTRNDVQCREKWLSMQHASQEQSWNRGDDETLRCLVEDEKASWQHISEKMQRDVSACQRHWELVQHRLRKKRRLEADNIESAIKRRKQGRWSLEETRLLQEGLAKHERDFAAIAEMVQTRNEIQCRIKWQSLMNAAAIDSTWTEAEDDALTNAIEQNGLAWETVAESVPGRPVSQCRRRWRVLKSKGRSGRLGRWKGDEVARLKLSVEEFGDDWVKIAERVGSRNAWQCRERLGIGWTNSDDARLREIVARVGEKWQEVRKVLPGFSEVVCRRRWKELQGKKVDSNIDGEITDDHLQQHDVAEE